MNLFNLLSSSYGYRWSTGTYNKGGYGSGIGKAVGKFVGNVGSKAQRAVEYRAADAFLNYVGQGLGYFGAPYAIRSLFRPVRRIV